MKRTPSLIFPLVLLSALLLSVLLPGCADRSPRNPLLREASRLLDSSPDSAAKADSLLQLVVQDSLSRGDRSLYALLRTKGDDRLYRTHTSDSLILTAVEYEKSHTARGLYPEALYYAGRVTCDLGDYPTATEYYQKAAGLTDNKEDHMELRSKILYQLAYCLNAQCLYEQAASTLQEALDTATHSSDSLRRPLLLELAADVALHRHEPAEAVRYLTEAGETYSRLDCGDTLLTDTQLAFIESSRGNSDRALALLRKYPSNSGDSCSRAFLYALRGRTYLRAGVPDSAYTNAMRLLYYPDFSNRHAALSILLDPRLSGMVDKDSLPVYAQMLAGELASHYEHRDSTLALQQRTTYNYSLHLAKRLEAEKRAEAWRIIGVACLLVIPVVIILSLTKSLRENKRTMALQKAVIDLTSRLEEGSKHRIEKDTEKENPEGNPPHSLENADRLRERLLEIIENPAREFPLEQQLRTSEVYARFRGFILRNRPEMEDWQKLSDAVHSVSPHFTERLTLLAAGNPIRESEMRLALLMRCHFTPGEIKSILGRSSGTVSKQRGDLSVRLFGHNLGAKAMESVIWAI